MPNSDDGRKLLFLVTEDWYFCSHRLSLAIAAKEAGYDVVVATRLNTHADVIRQAGLRFVPLRKLKRSSANPLREFRALIELAGIYRREKPDVVHHVALKPVVYGSIAARLTGVKGVVNAMAGLGFIFSSSKRKARLLRPLVIGVFRLLLARSRGRVIVQNEDDASVLQRHGIVGLHSLKLIRGAGVELDRYNTAMSADETPLVLLASRMLWDKGVGEFVEAARRLKAEGVQARFALVGDTDTENPASISQAQLLDWKNEGNVEWWGYQTDMPQVLKQARVVCLP